jgi:hypothetical protein
MTSRADFLATGLVPVTIPAPAAGEEEVDCSVCFDLLTNAVRLPCHPTHTFHELCISTWLADHNQCPLCKVVLFGPGDTPSTPHVSEVARALIAATGRPLEWFDTIALSGSDIGASAEMSRCFMVTDRGRRRDGVQMVTNIVEEHGRTAITGLGLVRCDTLVPNFVIMANMVFARAEVQGRAYTPEQIQHWRSPIKHIINRFRQKEGQMMNVVTFPRSMDRDLQEDLDRVYFGAGGVRHGTGAEETRLATLVRKDFKILMDYAAFLMWWQVHRPLLRRLHRDNRRVRCVVM